jgi:hypothetical protein
LKLSLCHFTVLHYIWGIALLLGFSVLVNYFDRVNLSVSQDALRASTAPRRSIVAVDVATADAAGCNAHENFTTTRRWFRKIGNLKMFVWRKQKNFHVPLAAARRISKTVNTLTHILRF